MFNLEYTQCKHSNQIVLESRGNARKCWENRQKSKKPGPGGEMQENVEQKIKKNKKLGLREGNGEKN